MCVDEAHLEVSNARFLPIVSAYATRLRLVEEIDRVHHTQFLSEALLGPVLHLCNTPGSSLSSLVMKSALPTGLPQRSSTSVDEMRCNRFPPTKRAYFAVVVTSLTD